MTSMKGVAPQMAANLKRLHDHLAKSTEIVEQKKTEHDAILVEERELQLRKVKTKEDLDKARAAQRHDVYQLLQAGASPTVIARQYGLSTATVHKYGQPADDQPTRSTKTR